jgi:multidrug efflux pump subunit AcrA (membrane-fusion protein)
VSFFSGLKLRGLPQRMLGAVALFTGALLLFSLFFAHCTEEVALQGVLTGDRHTVVVHTPAHGTVLRALVGVGDCVVSGAPLVMLDPNLTPEGLAEQMRRLASADQDRGRLEKARDLVAQLVSSPEKVRTFALNNLGLTGETFNLVNDLYTARLEFDNATEYRRLNVVHQKVQLASEAILVQRNIELLRRSLESSKKAAGSRDAALQNKRKDFEALMKLADKGLVSATDVSRERDGLLQAELAVNENHKQVDQIELDISNRSLHISEIKMQSETVEEDANNRLSAAKLRYELRLARLSEHRTSLDRQLKDAQLVPIIRSHAVPGSDSEAAPPAASLTLNSPVTGMVVKLGFTGVGDSLAAGQFVASIQPKDSRQMAMLEVSPLDALRLRPGQRAYVSIDAYPARRFGSIEGRVEKVFARPDGITFAAVVSLAKNTLQVRGVTAPLLPNFAVHATVELGQRRPYDLIFEP